MLDKDSNKGPIAHNPDDEDDGKHKRDDIRLRAAAIGHKIFSTIPIIVVGVTIVGPIGAIGFPVLISIRELAFLPEPVDQNIVLCEIHV